VGACDCCKWPAGAECKLRVVRYDREVVLRQNAPGCLSFAKGSTRPVYTRHTAVVWLMGGQSDSHRGRARPC
jgi:hypothetical protein